MSQRPSILVTGFDRFNRFQLNTSQVVVEHLRQSPPSSVALHTQVLPTSFLRATQVVNTILDKTNPDAVVLLGLLAGITAFRVEKIALNIDDAYSQDNDHDRPVQRIIIPSGPVAYESSWPANLIVERLIDNGIPAYISNYAGTYVCNHVFYTTLHRITEKQANTTCGFIHLPCLLEEASRFAEPLASMTLDVIFKGMEHVLDTLAETLKARAAVREGKSS